MHECVLSAPADFAGWRDQARTCLASGLPPEAVCWLVPDTTGNLFAGTAAAAASSAGPGPSVPAAFLGLARGVACHRDPMRFDLLYRLLWRLGNGERHLMAVTSDPDLSRAIAMAKSVRRDIHKMKAFVRFRETVPPPETGAAGPVFLAWFEPDHFIVEATAPFFMRRFAGMMWSILTPDRSAHWDGADLRFTAGARRRDVPDSDAMEAVWRQYYASIFNPARLKVKAMTAEMPKKYWKNLPESDLIRPLIASATDRHAAMVAAPPSQPPRYAQRRIDLAPPPAPASNAGSDDPIETLADLNRAAAGCRACPLWRPATQTVCGEGPETAPLMLVGEQPGDREDLAGRPFVGPAGGVLDRAMEAANIDREDAYLTNAVKHFKFAPRGTRRLHQRPNAGEIEACRWWLQREIHLVRPKVIVALGATAAQSLLRRDVKVLTERGTVMPIDSGTQLLITVHPSYLLRLPPHLDREAEFGRFVADLKLAGAALTS